MPMSRDGVRDAFWPQPWDAAAAVEECKARWGVVPRPEWATVSFGGRRIAYASNIVFSNGGYDPWRYGGVPTSLSRSLVAVFIPDGGHHVDLMSEHPEDTPTIKDARSIEKKEVKRWIANAYKGAALSQMSAIPADEPLRRRLELAAAAVLGATAATFLAGAGTLCLRLAAAPGGGDTRDTLEYAGAHGQQQLGGEQGAGSITEPLLRPVREESA